MKKKKALGKKIAVTLAAGALLCAGTVFAEEEETVFQLDQVTVTADRTAVSVGQTAANVTVITAEEIKNKGARSLGEALTGVSGVSVERYGGVGEFSNVYVLGSDKVVVLIDGKRMNLPQGAMHGRGGVDFSTILLGDDVERIEVVRGGASTLYGADAVGGVINIITKKGTGATNVSASVAAGNYGSRDYAISANGQEGKIRWRLSGLRNNSDGQDVNSSHKNKDVSFRFDYDLTKGESLTFTYDYYGNHAGMPGSTQYGPRRPNDFQDILRHNWSVGYTKEHAAGSRIFRYYDNNQAYSGDIYGSISRHRNILRAFEYQDSARLNEANLLTWGGEWRKEEVQSTDEGNMNRDRTTKALFLQNQYDFNSTSKLTLGLRWDDNSVYGAHWLPKLAYLYQPNAKTSYYVNWGKVFKAPTFDDLYWFQESSDDWGVTYNYYMHGNPNLKAETGWTAEIGMKTKINNANEATLSVFKRSINNAIRWKQTYYNEDWGNLIIDDVWDVYNIDKYTATGINANLISVFSPATTADIGYTYLNSHDQNGASVGDPRHIFHIGVNIRSGKWKQSVYGIFHDKTGTLKPSSYPGADPIDSRLCSNFIVNTHTSYSINKETSLFLTINNLFNREYQAVKHYPANKFNYLFGIKYSM